MRYLSDRTQGLDATTDADDYVGRYARMISSQNSYNVFDRDLPGEFIVVSLLYLQPELKSRLNALAALCPCDHWMERMMF